MNLKILTITIPTWNRAQLLKELLDELIEQITTDSLESKIELLISNNGSKDETEEYVLSLKLKYDFITYNNNGINKGARYNVLKCMELANSNYLILFGDDDRPRKGSIKDIVKILEKNSQIGTLYDSHNFKKNPFGNSKVTLNQLLENFFYYLGNAGLFIVKSDYVKSVLKAKPYDFFSPTWPQTQIFILASQNHQSDEIRIVDLNILAKGRHDDVMIYSSYYLWRTTYYDFIDAIEKIKGNISNETYFSAKNYFKKNVNQLFFNILQCGVFLDEKNIRHKTAKDILKNISKFSSTERIFLVTTSVVLYLPVLISRFFSNSFIYITRGKKGMIKKNEFILKEKRKMETKLKNINSGIREFDFINI